MANEVKMVPFHGHTLFLVERNNEPYTPMKPIVEGMGLDWKSQYTKIASNQARWGMVKITIQVPEDTQYRETVLIPLRKTAAWLMTVSPNKVKPEIREKILLYQNECDDVLWKYWTRGAVVNPRVPAQDLGEVVRQAVAEYARTKAPDPEIERARLNLEMARFQADKAMKLKEMAFDLQSRGIFDLRYIRRVVEHSVSLLTGEVVSPKVMIDLSAWLGSRGIPLSGGNAMAFGKTVADVYRRVRGREPGKRPMLIRGREILANYYQEPDDLPVLEEAFVLFKKTIKTPKTPKTPGLLPLFGGKTT
ncbi:phage antirepressor N-terminal domain-containing protein [Leptospirillum ferriphilum]|uniref:phage antirepressor N-terminal domain-containing protein n=1 Tax=Leptospirillum ferriphilum TaxID=178606 RepID=UPI0006B1897C|nr:phage antirepressor N-terminal domain-containing protein [Leptospirillum ferriphilum]